jgi:hypothetical protein
MILPTGYLLFGIAITILIYSVKNLIDLSHDKKIAEIRKVEFDKLKAEFEERQTKG